MAAGKAVAGRGFGNAPGWLVYLLATAVFGGSAALSEAGFGNDRTVVRALSVTAAVLLGALALLCLTESVAAIRVAVRQDGAAP